MDLTTDSKNAAANNTAGDAVGSPPAEVRVVNSDTQYFTGGSYKVINLSNDTKQYIAYDTSGNVLGTGSTIAETTDRAATVGKASTEYLTGLNSAFAHTQNTATGIGNMNSGVLAGNDPATSIAMGPLPAQAPTPPVTKKNKTNNDSGATTTAAKSNVNDNTTLSAQPTANPLAAYASYTYGLALHLLPPEQYRQLINNPGVAFKPTVTLVASAGRYNSTPPRDASFTDDFYFDNFKLSSVIGLNAVNRGSNAVNLQFSLIEPYGLSFLNRLLDTATRLNIPNYLDVPYLLEISFYGADDDGMYAKLSGQTKLIPIRILGIKIRAGSKGSEYQITAVPYGSLAHMQSLAATKANFSITSRTVGEFFKNMADDYGSVNAGAVSYTHLTLPTNREV